MLAIYITSKGSPKEKLKWAYKVYDIDGNGTIEFGEMKWFYNEELLCLRSYQQIFFRVVNAVYKVL